jgi:hypothetical protein
MIDEVSGKHFAAIFSFDAKRNMVITPFISDWISIHQQDTLSSLWSLFYHQLAYVV